MSATKNPVTSPDVRPTPNKPLIGPRSVVYENQYQQIYRVKADFGEFSKEYVVKDSGHRAGVLVVDAGSVLLVRQYRILIDGLSWEIAGGKVDEDETPETAAIRECLEETGVRVDDLSPLMVFQPGMDTTHNATQIFYTKHFLPTDKPSVVPWEVIEQAWVPLSDCLAMIAEGNIVDSLTVIGLLDYSTFIQRDGQRDRTHIQP